MNLKITLTTGLKKDPLKEPLLEFKKIMAADTYFAPRTISSTEELKTIVKTYNYSFISWNANYRNAPNFAEANGIMIDIDGGITLVEAEAALKTLGCYALMITTQNHQKLKANKSGVLEQNDRFRIIIPTSRKFHVFSDLKNSLEPLNAILNNSIDMAAFLASQFFIPSPDDATTIELSSTSLYDPNKILRTGVYTSKDPTKPNHRNIQDSWILDNIGGLLDKDRHQLTELPKEKTILYCPFCPDLDSASPSAWIDKPKSDDKTRVIHCSHCDASYYSKVPVLTDQDFIERVAYSAADIEDDPEPAQWIVDQVLAQSECFSIFGEAGSGKSYAILQLAISVASGVIKEWLGYPIIRYGTVLYILNDGSHRSLKNRIRRISGFLKIPKPKDLYILNDQGTFESWAEDAERFINIKKPILVIIDSLSMSVDHGDENSASDQKKYSNLLKTWCLTYNINVAVVHHVTKAASDRPMHMNNFRGSNHWVGVMASMMEFRKSPTVQMHNIYKLVKSRDGDPKYANVRESEYVEVGDDNPHPGVYDLTQSTSCSGYRYVGASNESGVPSKSGSSKLKRTPYIKDFLTPGETKPYGDLLEDIMIAYTCGKTTAKQILKEFRDEGLVEKTKNETGAFFYTSLEKPK